MKGRARTSLVFIRMTATRMYRAAADNLDGPVSYMITANTSGFLNGKAPGAPHLQVAEVEYGENQTVRIEVAPEDYTLAD